MRYHTVSEIWRRHSEHPYEVGQWDCMMLALDVADTLGDTDLLSEWRGRYTTLRGAARILRRLGRADLTEFAVEELSLPRRPLAQCRWGDLAVGSTGRAEHMFVCLGGGWGTRTENGPLVLGIGRMRTGLGVG